jgi:hypothetical protein
MSMPVDRVNRDALADALAAFMRGDLAFEALRSKVETIYASLNAKSVFDQGLIFLLISGFSESDQQFDRRLEKDERFEKRKWERRRRELAFLKSDVELQLKDMVRPPSQDDYSCIELRARCCHALALALAFRLSVVIGGWGWCVYWTACIVSFSVDQYLERLRIALNNEQSRWFAVFPFANEEQWLAHEKLLENYRLPSIEPVLESKPIPKRRWVRVLDAVWGWCAVVVALPVTWPIYLVITSFWEIWRTRGTVKNAA